jgi:poly-gamma-glutamate synthesis protein (capsule biosynthesis protein)
MLGRLVDLAILAKGPRYPWGDVLPLVQAADLSLVNLECVIAESGEPFTPRRVFYFRAHPEASLLPHVGSFTFEHTPRPSRC